MAGVVDPTDNVGCADSVENALGDTAALNEPLAVHSVSVAADDCDSLRVCEPTPLADPEALALLELVMEDEPDEVAPEVTVATAESDAAAEGAAESVAPDGVAEEDTEVEREAVAEAVDVIDSFGVEDRAELRVADCGTDALAEEADEGEAAMDEVEVCEDVGVEVKMELWVADKMEEALEVRADESVAVVVAPDV